MECAAEQICEEVLAPESIQELTEGTSSARLSESATAEGDATPRSGIGDRDSTTEEHSCPDSAALGDGAARPAESAATSAASASSGSASGDRAAEPAAPALTMRANILQLKQEQRELRASNKAKTREIRNTERRSKRLKSRVGGITDEDLNEVLRARAEAKAAAAIPKAAAKSRSSGGRTTRPPVKRAVSDLADEDGR